MKRKSRALGLALFAVFALSAVLASGASAAGELFHSEVSHTILNLTQDGTEGGETGSQIFKVTLSGDVRCEGVKGSATISAGTRTEITVVPEYTQCLITGAGTKIHFRMRSCAYVFTSEKVGTHAAVHIECSIPGDHIRLTMTVLGAEVVCKEYPAQTPTGGGVVYHNVGSGTTREITIETTVSGLEHTDVGMCGELEAEDETFTGNMLLKASSTEGRRGWRWG